MGFILQVSSCLTHQQGPHCESNAPAPRVLESSNEGWTLSTCLNCRILMENACVCGFLSLGHAFSM